MLAKRQKPRSSEFKRPGELSKIGCAVLRRRRPRNSNFSKNRNELSKLPKKPNALLNSPLKNCPITEMKKICHL